MRSTVVVFPFDVYGAAGTGAGAEVLGDAVREILDDTEAETRPCRADCLRGRVRLREVTFDTAKRVHNWRRIGRRIARRHLDRGDFLFWLGGNHLSVLPVLEELGPDTLVVQFDAHLDLYSFHDNTPHLSHGNFLKHLPAPHAAIVNVGHRDLFLTPQEIAGTFLATYPAWQVTDDLMSVVRELLSAAASAPRLWIDIDADVFDPAVLPAVQEPLPFGLTALSFLRLLNALWGTNLAGVSIAEFDPGRDHRETGLRFLGWLLEYLLLKVHERPPPLASSK